MKTYTNLAFPGKTFRRLEVGEKIRGSDVCHSTSIEIFSACLTCEAMSGMKVESYEGDNPEPLYYYREVPTPEPTQDPSALMLQRIEEAIQKLDAVLAKLNA